MTPFENIDLIKGREKRKRGCKTHLLSFGNQHFRYASYHTLSLSIKLTNTIWNLALRFNYLGINCHCVLRLIALLLEPEHDNPFTKLLFSFIKQRVKKKRECKSKPSSERLLLIHIPNRNRSSRTENIIVDLYLM